jgi:hypothetical protein
MFTFGFGAIFALTQIPGLPCLQHRHVVLRIMPSVVFVIVYVTVFVATPTWTSPQVLFYIPTAEYLGAIAMNYLFWLAFRCMNGHNPDDMHQGGASAVGVSIKEREGTEGKEGEEGKSKAKVVELGDMSATHAASANTNKKQAAVKYQHQGFQRLGETQIDAGTRKKWICAR